MGTDIYGSVEIKQFDDDWFEIIDIGIALGGDYDVYACLFGIRNYANFEPLFANRGFPDNYSHDLHGNSKTWEGVSWCTYQELLDIDLDEKNMRPHQRPQLSLVISPENKKSKPQKYMTRREALSHPDFQQLMELMAVLAKRYGNEGVRMVVHFFG